MKISLFNINLVIWILPFGILSFGSSDDRAESLFRKHGCSNSHIRLAEAVADANGVPYYEDWSLPDPNEDAVRRRIRRSQMSSLRQTCEGFMKRKRIYYTKVVPGHVEALFQAFHSGVTLSETDVDPNCTDCRGYTLLHYAVMNVSDFVVEKLLEQKASVNIKNVVGNTPLHTACTVRPNDIVFSTRILSIISRLIKAEAQVNAQNNDGKTPLHLAVEHDQLSTVAMLLEGDINVEIEDKAGQTPLFIALRRMNLGIAVTLIKHGADKERADIFGQKSMDTMPMHIESNRCFVVALADALEKR